MSTPGSQPPLRMVNLLLPKTKLPTQSDTERQIEFELLRAENSREILAPVARISL